MAEQQKKPCALCKLSAQHVEIKDYGERLRYNCERCGHFSITRGAERIGETTQLSIKLSAWVRDRNEKGADIPEINSNTLKEIANALPEYSPSEKQLILLRNIERKSKYPGYPVNVVPLFDAPLAWASETREFSYYLKSLHDRGLLEFNEEILGIVERSGSHEVRLPVTISADGWDYLEEKATRIEDKKQVFVAMSFSEKMKPAWDNAFKPAITEAGYKPYRIDAEPHIDRIDTKIIAEINNSRFIVADVTEHKHGVYFEAGYALGLGLPVIWCVHEEHLSEVHFDTRQYNHIVWNSHEQLKEQLYNFICAVMGKPR